MVAAACKYVHHFLVTVQRCLFGQMHDREEITPSISSLPLRRRGISHHLGNPPWKRFKKLESTRGSQSLAYVNQIAMKVKKWQLRIFFDLHPILHSTALGNTNLSPKTLPLLFCNLISPHLTQIKQTDKIQNLTKIIQPKIHA
jgi:hypothetical protein